MSAFAVVCDFSEVDMTGDPIVFHKVMQRLVHRGPDGSNMMSARNIHMGCWHLWTTPEEVGEFQPLRISGLPFVIVFDGRIDNRDELFALLGISFAHGKALSDAALILHAYACRGEDCFKDFVGEFALVIFNEQTREVVAVRDHLGDRTLFYAFYGTQLVIASEPWAVVGASPSKLELNETAVAHYFAVKVPQDGQTFFKNVRELLPAHILKVGVNGHWLWRYWSPDPYKKIRYGSSEEYAGHFRVVVEESIRSRMRSAFPVGVLMSGGLDSTSIACLAARMITPEKLTTISYVFDELSDADERYYIEAVKQQYGIHSIQIPCDDAWTFKNWDAWPRNPNEPEGNFYRLVLERVIQRAQEAGLRVLLTGHVGDQLYSAGLDGIADLLVDLQLSAAAREFILQIKELGWRQVAELAHIRRIMRRIVDTILPGALRLSLHQDVRVWTSPSYRHLFRRRNLVNRVFDRHGMLLSLEVANDMAHVVQRTSRHQIEFRNPFRDRRVVEYILAIPAYQLLQHGIPRYILRTAMQGILPDIIRSRYGKTSFVSLYQRGLEREREQFEVYMKDKNAEWRKYFHSDWYSKILQMTCADGAEGVLPFLCASYGIWHQSLMEHQ